MGFWSKAKKGIDVAKTIAPLLPIPAKAKRIVAKVGEAEEDVEAIVDEVKPAQSSTSTNPKGTPMKMRMLVLLLALVSAPAFAQNLADPKTITTSGSTCSAANCVRVRMDGVPSVGISVVNAGTYTLEIEASKDRDGSTFTPFNAVDETDTSALVQEITAPGEYTLANSGIRWLQIRASAYTSGTPVINVVRGVLAPLLEAGAGGGGGTAATEYTEGASDATITGVAMLMEDSNTLRPAQGSVADGLLVNLGSNNDVTVTGTVTVSDGAGALNVIVDSSASVAVTNAGTFATQVDGAALTALQNADADLTTIDGRVDGLETLIGTTNTTLTTIDGRVDGIETLLGTTNTSLAIIDNVVFGAGTEAAALRVTIATDSTGVLSVDDNGGSLTIDGTISCSNCSGSGASLVDDAAFGVATDSIAPAGFLFDDVAPDSVNEGDVGLGRMSANRNQYMTIRDAAGNERGASVTAANELLVELGAGSASIGTLGANSGVDIGDVTLTAGSASIGTLGANSGVDIGDVTLTASDNDIGNVDLELAGTAVSATNPVAMRLSDGSSFVTLGSDSTVGTAIATTGTTGIAVYSDFDGSAIPTATNVDTEGEAVPIAASIKGVQYMMLVSEDGSLQYGTSTTPLVVGDGSGALNVIIDSSATLTVNAHAVTNAGTFAVQVDGSALTALQLIDNAAVSEDVASADADGLWRVAAIRDDTLDARSGTEGDYEPFHLNANGALWAIDVNSAAALTSTQLLDDVIFTDDAAFTPGTSKGTAVGFQADDTSTDSVDEGDFGVPRMSLDRIMYQRPGGATVHYRTSAGSTEDEHEIKATAGTLYSILITNTNAAARYIRCYNLTAANTTPGTSTVFWGAAIPGATTGAGFSYHFPAGLTFDTALTCAWTTGAADTDVAEVAANEIKATYTFR